MPLPRITVKKLKDGREVASFRDNKGLVRTSAGMSSGTIATAGYGTFRAKWTRAEQIRKLAEYGIAMQVAQARAGIGSNGAPMPPLKSSGFLYSSFVERTNGRARFRYQFYPEFKSAHGLQVKRDLYGPGLTAGQKSTWNATGNSHMLDDIRINYLDDTRATISITNQSSRTKARANEKRVPWWGWTPQSISKMQQYSGQLFGTGPAERLFELGLIGVSALGFVQAKYLRRAA